MTLDEVYILAEQSGIVVFNEKLPITKCLSVMDFDGNCAVGIDESQFKTQSELKVGLAHDIAHCLTGSFYNRYSPYDVRERHENKANKKATYLLINLNDLIDAFNDPWNSVYDLAERFNVTEPFMRKALSIYEQEIKNTLTNEGAE